MEKRKLQKINTKELLLPRRLFSLPFPSHRLPAAIKDSDPKQMFLVFDLVNGKLIIEGNELFRDDLVWSEAVKAMKASLLADYQGDPSCDLFSAPKHNGFSASWIGVDRGLGL